jgi:hypothetical protein
MKTHETKSEKPSERFKKALSQILSVSKSELDRREAKYRNERAVKKSRSKHS